MMLQQFWLVHPEEAARRMTAAYRNYLEPPHRLDWDFVIEGHKGVCYDGSQQVARLTRAATAPAGACSAGQRRSPAVIRTRSSGGAVEALTYYSPDGEHVPDPPLQLLHQLVFERGQDHYNRGWGGGALQVLRYTRDGVEVLNGQPSLEFFYLAPHGRFLRYYSAEGGMLVPYDGSGCARLMRHYYGGDPMPVPIACCVPREVAFEVVQAFCRSRQPSPAVAWTRWGTLPIPEEAWRPA
jgi:hypothetical protein